MVCPIRIHRSFAGFLAGLILLFSVLMIPDGWAQEYLAEIPDFPIMEGLTELAEARVVFDKPDGRIVTAALEGSVALANARNFYLTSLGELGWRLTQESGNSAIYRFEREQEILTLRFQAGPDYLTVEIALGPRAGVEY